MKKQKHIEKVKREIQHACGHSEYHLITQDAEALFWEYELAREPCTQCLLHDPRLYRYFLHRVA